jgi:transposase
MGNQGRRRWTAEEKLAIIEEARQAGQTVSEVCRRHGIATGQFYAWEKKARQGALEGLWAGKRKQSGREAQLKEEITRLRAVAAELSAENLELKKGRWP